MFWLAKLSQPRALVLSAVALSLSLTALYVFLLPLGISYDGLIYIDLSGVLGSSRFPKDWHFARVPLYPAVLKFAFFLFGRNAIACSIIGAVLGGGTIVALAIAASKTSSRLAAAIVALLLPLNATLVAFQHMVLTEIGTGLFLSATIVILILRPGSLRAAWTQTAVLTVVLSTAYYWRQGLLALAPLAAVLFVVSTWRAAQTRIWRRVIGLQALCICLIPIALSQGWRRYADDASMMEIMYRHALIRQMLLPPDHKFVGQHREYYERAIRETPCAGMMSSGLRNEQFAYLYARLFPMPNSAKEVFGEMIRQHPVRYLGGVGRTFLDFAHAGRCESEIIPMRIITLAGTKAKNDGSWSPLEVSVRNDFARQVPVSFIAKLLIASGRPEDWFLSYAHAITVLGLLFAIATHNFRLSVMCLLPLFYELTFAVVLASVDRYGVPAYPAILANGVIVPTAMLQWWKTSGREAYSRFRGRKQVPSST